MDGPSRRERRQSAASPILSTLLINRPRQRRALRRPCADAVPQQRCGKRSRVCVALRLCLLFSVFVTITARVLTQRALLRAPVSAMMNSELI